MEKQEFKQCRQLLDRTQEALAHLLGISVKAVRSYEQGWRQIPGYVERQMLLLSSFKANLRETRTPCWEITGCTDEQKKACPAWELNAGTLCWFVNGTICAGAIRENWSDKMTICRNCKVFPPVENSIRDIAPSR